VCDIGPKDPGMAAPDAGLALPAHDHRAFRHQEIMDDVAVREREAKATGPAAMLAA
jgi:hypothetical protein